MADRAAAAEEDQAVLIGPPRPPGLQAAGRAAEQTTGRRVNAFAESSSDDSDGDNSDGGEARRRESEVLAEVKQLPLGMHEKLRGHEKPVNAVALDRSGSRLLTGCAASRIHLWDFNSMDRRLASFRTLEPDVPEIKQLQYTPSGDMFLAVTGERRVRLFDRDGREQRDVEFKVGDMYLQDLANTKGHTAEVAQAHWHAWEKGRILTGGADATLRLWSIDNPQVNDAVIKVKTASGGRSVVTACAWSNNGSLAAAAASTDGSLQLWPVAGPMSKPSHVVRSAHAPGTDTSAVVFASDSQTLATRGGDDTLKLWDLRRMQQPVFALEGLSNENVHTGLVFSPSGLLMATGLSARRGEPGRVVFVDTLTGQLRRAVNVCDGNALGLVWHPRLNQVFVSSADADVHVLYHPQRSQGGVVPAVERAFKRKHDAVVALDDTGFSATTRGQVHDAMRKMRRRGGQDTADAKARAPKPPSFGKGMYGNVVTNSVASFMQERVRVDKRSADIREEMLSHDVSDKRWTGTAWDKTQPKALFAAAESGDVDNDGGDGDDDGE